MKLYHGTTTESARIILKEGLKPMPIDLRIWNKGVGNKPRPSHRDTSVYLAGTIILALSYAQMAARKKGDFPAILTIDLPHTENLRVDDDYMWIANPMYSKNWEVAFNTTMQVAHKGEIPPRYLS